MKRKFYCEHCAAEVPLIASECPSCHRGFGEVLCPKCRHSGASPTFANGCPACGYLAVIQGEARGSSLFAPVMFVMSILLVVAAGVAWVVRR